MLNHHFISHLLFWRWQQLRWAQRRVAPCIERNHTVAAAAALMGARESGVRRRVELRRRQRAGGTRRGPQGDGGGSGGAQEEEGGAGVGLELKEGMDGSNWLHES